jgi:HSP20 family molecular chaperone IbpA
MSLFSQLIPSRNVRPTAGASAANGEKEYTIPAYEVKESTDAFGLEVFMPGVAKDAVEISIDQGELVVTGARTWKSPEGWTEVFRESSSLDFRLRLDLNDAVNVDKINAELEAGVLRVTLPKAEELKPRRIDVN